MADTDSLADPEFWIDTYKHGMLKMSIIRSNKVCVITTSDVRIRIRIRIRIQATLGWIRIQTLKSWIQIRIRIQENQDGFGFERGGFGSGFWFEVPRFAHHWLLHIDRTTWSTTLYETDRKTFLRIALTSKMKTAGLVYRYWPISCRNRQSYMVYPDRSAV